MIRHFFVKQNLLHDLELQLLKAEAIREWMQRKLKENQDKIEQNGYETIDNLTTAYGEIKKELKEKLKPYENGKPMPEGFREELQPLEDKRKLYEAIIDERADFEKNVAEKDELIAETIFYINKIKFHGSDWLQQAHQEAYTKYGFPRE